LLFIEHYKNCVKYQRLSRWGDRTSVDMPRAYVIIKLTFSDRNLGTEPLVLAVSG